MIGMTLRQFARHRFFTLLEQYRNAKLSLDTKEGRDRFVALSIQLHASKSSIPKHLWSLVNRS